MSYDLIFECDYGERKRLKNLLKELVEKYNAKVMPMAAIFVNNNPYTLELYTVLSFESEYIELKDEIVTRFNELGYSRNTTITFMDLIAGQGKRKFNSCTFTNSKSVENSFRNSSIFFFNERNEIRNMNYDVEYSKPEKMMFISYCSKDEKQVDDLVAVLNGRAISTFFAQTSIDFGESIVEKVQDATDECVGAIFYVTKNYLKSSWCKVEMETFMDKYTSDRNTLMITIKDKDVSRNDLPPFLRNIKYVDLNEYSNLNDVVNIIKPTIERCVRKNHNFY